MTPIPDTDPRALLAPWPHVAQLPITALLTPSGTPRRDVWRVGDGLYLKRGSRDALSRSVRLARALAAQGLPAALPVPTRDGDALSPGDRPCLLLPALPGSPLRAEDCLSSPATARLLGDTLARLHRALSAVDEPARDMNLPGLVRDWALPTALRDAARAGHPLPEEPLRDAAEALVTLTPRLPAQLLHRDPCPGNVLMEGGAVTGLLDFDLTVRGPRLWDIGYLTTGILSEAAAPGDGRWPRLLEAVLTGYHARSPLTDAERQALWPLLCAIVLVCLASFGQDDACRRAADANRAMLETLLTLREAVGGIAHSLPPAP